MVYLKHDIYRRYTILVGKASICDSGFGGDCGCDCFGIIIVVLSVVGLETGTAQNVGLLKNTVVLSVNYVSFPL